ncbi:hypothetical protein [Enterococcus alishanensis]
MDEFTNIIIQTPKTASGTCSISMDNETVNIMSKWRVVQRTDYLSMGFNTSSEDQYIFTNVKRTILSINRE